MFSVVHKTIVTNAISGTRLTLLAINHINHTENQANFSVNSVNLGFAKNRWTGLEYVTNPHINKGLAFTIQERQLLGIQGLLAANYKTQEEQIEICRLSIERYKDPLNKYLYLSDLLDTNERLFYSLLATDIEKYLPIVYTPTVGLACQKFGFNYRKPKGLFITIHDKGRVFEILKNWPLDLIYAIVVTDGERILGLGDLGAFGMGIPIGKLSLYTALAGVKPHRCLPICLDVGCNNEKIVSDPLYIGLRQKRVRGKEYDEFIEEFMQACVKIYGRNVLIQFEDFAQQNAIPLLAKYRDHYCTFNDDIQGTASVVVAGILAAVKITQRKVSDNIFFFFGAGAAGVGIADLLVSIMVEEGISKEESQKKVFLFDVDGVLTNKRSSGIPAHATHFAKDIEPSKDLLQTITNVKATCLIGVSTVGGAFKPEILKQMSKNTDRPMIFALSNPTANAECSAQDAYDHTEGRCIFASGSPFPPVKHGGKEYRTGQGNNSYIFPGVGLGVISCQMTTIPDYIFITAAKIVADNVTESDISIGRVYPSLTAIRKVSFDIAKAVINKAYETNIAGLYPKPTDLDTFIQGYMYDLKYPSYMPDLYEYPAGYFRNDFTDDAKTKKNIKLFRYFV